MECGVWGRRSPPRGIVWIRMARHEALRQQYFAKYLSFIPAPAVVRGFAVPLWSEGWIPVAQSLESTASELKSNIKTVARYLIALSAISLVAEFEDGLFGTLAGMARPFACVAGLYLLLEAMLQGHGMPRPRYARGYFSLAGLLILILVGVVSGLSLFIVPGIVLMARWVLAPSLLVGGPQGVFDALGNSWASTRGHTLPLVLATMVLLSVPLAASVGLDSIEAAAEVELVIWWVMFHIANVLLAGLSVSLSQRLADKHLRKHFAPEAA